MVFQPLAKKDSFVILRGLLILAAIIFTGVAAAQYQLASLTQKEDQTFFSLTRDDNYRYCVSFLGSDGHLGRLYHLGDIGQSDGRLVYQAAGYQFSIPVHLHFGMDMEQAKSWLKAASVYFKQLAYAAKTYFEERAPVIIQYLPQIK